MTHSGAEKRIHKKHTTMTVIEMVEDFTEKRLIIPPHQREYRWDLSRQRKFIRSVLKEYPIPMILMSKDSVGIYIEDGRQRIETLTRFTKNEFGIDWSMHGVPILYTDLTDKERDRFNDTPISICEFRGASPEERIEIFDYWQNGAPLSVGERYHAQYASPLVSFVKELLMTPGEGYHDRAAKIWGPRGDPVDTGADFVSKDKRRNWLLNATALVMGLLCGPANATKTYEPDRGFITTEIPNAKKEAVKRDLERILEIYEDANERVPLEGKKSTAWFNRYWEIGNFTNYILFSLSVSAREEHNIQQMQMEGPKQSFEDSCYAPNSLADKPEEEERIKDTWVDYISGLRERMKHTTKPFKNVLQETIHANRQSSRAFNICRWEDGFKRVFCIPLNDTLLTRSCSSDDEYNSDEDCNSE
jgi:hypothetical protein